ncbi:hypothetical protein AB0H76_11580 [Nocardia sp. NPDC050712]
MPELVLATRGTGFAGGWRVAELLRETVAECARSLPAQDRSER